jgi:hypothetical protein
MADSLVMGFTSVVLFMRQWQGLLQTTRRRAVPSAIEHTTHTLSFG